MSLRYSLKPTDFIPEALSLGEVEFLFRIPLGLLQALSERECDL